MDQLFRGLGVEEEKNQNKNMPKLGHYLLNKKSKNYFFVKKKHRNQFLGGLGVEKLKIIKNMPKLGHYLPFEQKSENDFFVEKPKNPLFRWLGVESPTQKQKYAKRRSLPTV